MRISIVGWYGKANVGDECFRFVLSDFFAGHELEFVTPPQTCNSPDIVILGGGAVASPFYLDILPLNVPKYAIGIDMAYESEIELLHKAQFRSIFVRNKTDFAAMSFKLNCPVYWTPDLAFYLKPSKIPILWKYKKTNKKTLGIFATDYINPAIDRPIDKFAERAWSFKINLAKKLDQLSEEYEILLVPCSTGGYGDDRRINLDLAAFMKNNPTNIMDTLDPQEMIDLTSELDAAICMRFHAHIFSMISRIPFVSIGLTRKVKLLLQEHELNKVIGASMEDDQFKCEDLEKHLFQPTFDPTNYWQQLSEVKRIVRRDWLQESV